MSAGVLYVNLQELEISEWLKLHGVYLILGQLLIRPDTSDRFQTLFLLEMFATAS